MRVTRDGVRHDGELVEQLVDVFCSAVRRREQFPEGLQIDGSVSRRGVSLREDRGPPFPALGAPLPSYHLPAPVRLQQTGRVPPRPGLAREGAVAPAPRQAREQRRVALAARGFPVAGRVTAPLDGPERLQRRDGLS